MEQISKLNRSVEFFILSVTCRLFRSSSLDTRSPDGASNLIDLTAAADSQGQSPLLTLLPILTPTGNDASRLPLWDWDGEAALPTAVVIVALAASELLAVIGLANDDAARLTLSVVDSEAAMLAAVVVVKLTGGELLAVIWLAGDDAAGLSALVCQCETSTWDLISRTGSWGISSEGRRGMIQKSGDIPLWVWDSNAALLAAIVIVTLALAEGMAMASAAWAVVESVNENCMVLLGP